MAMRVFENYNTSDLNYENFLPLILEANRREAQEEKSGRIVPDVLTGALENTISDVIAMQWDDIADTGSADAIASSAII